MWLKTVLLGGGSLLLAACVAFPGPIALKQGGGHQSVQPSPQASSTGTPDRLKQTIAQAMPELQNPQLDDWTKVNLLRRWAYRNIDMASTCSSNYSAPDVAHRDAPAIFADFAADKGGVLCAGASDSLLRLYQYYGYEAYSIHFGAEKTSLTHTLTLVKIQHQGKSMLVVEDAYFNNTYTDLQDAPLDYWQLLQMLRQRQDAKVKILQQYGDQRDTYHCGKTLLPEKYYNLTAKDLGAATVLNPGRTKFAHGLTYTTFAQYHNLLPEIYAFLGKHNYPPDLKYLFLFPYYASDGNNQQPQIVRQAKQIIQGQSLAFKAHF